MAILKVSLKKRWNALKKMENILNDSNDKRTGGIAKSFLPYERGYKEKIKRIAKKYGIEVNLTRWQILKQKISAPSGKKLKKQGVVYSVRCKSKRCKMQYIEETGTQLKIPNTRTGSGLKISREKLRKKKKIDYLVFRNI